MQQPVEDGGGDHCVAEDLSPLCEALVGCEDDAAPLVSGRYQAEEGGGSLTILASMLSRTQDLITFQMVLFAAIRSHGSPEALVSDGGGVFRAKQAQRIYEALGIRKEQIRRRQPWQSYIETTFNVQRRMADWHFAKATTWAELQASRERWVADYNYQDHWAHRERQDNRHSPSQVLGWVIGNNYALDELHRIFYATRFERVLNKGGYARFRHWQVYGERGLARQRVAVWLV